ncbi:MAG: Fic family protein [Actinomycetes bacterium]
MYRRLDDSVAELHARFGGLPAPEEARGIWSDIWHLEAHHSTALEGNTLVLRQVEVLLDQGKTVGARPLKDYLEVKGYGQAAEWVYGHALRPDDWEARGLVSLSEVRHVHQLAMTPVWEVAPHPDASHREVPGMFREHDLRPFGDGMSPPSWALVPSALQDWLDRVEHLTPDLVEGRTETRPLPEMLAEIHNGFERVHPFIDGNGRAGRLVLNLILVRLGFPPAIILKSRREHYLSAMQRADSGDFGPLGEMIARAIYDNINRFVLPVIAGEHRPVPLAALVSSEFSLAALKQAAQRGRLHAIQGPDGTWMSTKQAVSDYRASKGSHRKESRSAFPPAEVE